MPLIEYSSSDEESVKNSSSNTHSVATSIASVKKRKRDETEPVKDALPPLPPVFHTLFVTAPRTHPCDDPALHGGRTRQVPHVEGNWPTHVYLEWYPPRKEVEVLETLVDAANMNGEVQSLLQSDLGAQLPLHISLSAPLSLKAEHKSDFEEAIESSIVDSGVGIVEAFVASLRWERNFDGTRWFLVLGVVTLANHELNSMQKKPAQTSMEQQKIQKIVPPDRSDSFHISIAWQLTEPVLKQRLALTHTNVARLGQGALKFEVVKLKMGNVVKNIRLSKRSMAN